MRVLTCSSFAPNDPACNSLCENSITLARTILVNIIARGKGGIDLMANCMGTTAKHLRSVHCWEPSINIVVECKVKKSFLRTPIGYLYGTAVDMRH